MLTQDQITHFEEHLSDVVWTTMVQKMQISKFKVPVNHVICGIECDPTDPNWYKVKHKLIKLETSNEK